MMSDAELLSRLGAALGGPSAGTGTSDDPSQAALQALAASVHAQRVAGAQHRSDRSGLARSPLQGIPVRRYVAIAAVVALSPVAACATTALAGMDPPAPLRPVAALLGLDPPHATPDPADAAGSTVEQGLGAGVPADAVADTIPVTAPAAVPSTAGPSSHPSIVPPPTLAEHTHTTVPETPGAGSPPPDATPNVDPATPGAPGSVTPPTTQPDPPVDPAPVVDPAGPGNPAPTPNDAGPGAARSGR